MLLAAVSEDVWNNIIRYSGFAAASYSDYCAVPPSGSTVVKYFNVSFTDTQATLFRDDKAQEIILSFRGSSSPKDLDTDFEFTLAPLTATGTSCSSCKVHSSFQIAYESVASAVISAVQSELSSSGYSKFTITGHSLGAALSSIATASFIGSGVKVANTYTFGEPRNGDAAWASYLSNQIPDSNYFRVTHYNDGVPQIPPTVLGFQHHGPEYWQSLKLQNSASTTYSCGTNSTVQTLEITIFVFSH